MRLRYPGGDSRLPHLPSPFALAVGVVAVAVAVLAIYGAGALVAARRTSAVDQRLQTAVQQARVTILARVAAADRRVSTLAASPRVQEAFASRDALALARLRKGMPSITFVLGSRTIGSTPHAPSIASTVDVYGNGGRLGAVVVRTILGGSLLHEARRRAPLRAPDLLALVRSGRIVSGPRVGLEVGARNGAFTARLGARRYRALAQPLGSRAASTGLVALSPEPRNPIGAVQGAEAAGGALALLVAALTLFPRRLSAEQLRSERRRRLPPEAVKTARSAIALVGDTLAATHNPQALLPVVLSAAIEATGAAGGYILERDGIVSSRGDIVRTEQAVVADLGTARDLRLMLFPPPGGFPADAREIAGWFAEQASIALENANLHDLVRRQAVTDDMTGLANRRGFMTALASETSRAERLGTPLALVLADVDDFKKVNDRYGHPIGDAVLIQFGRVLQSTVRDVDVPARLGGEEFGVLLPDTALAGAVELAERLRTDVAESALPADGGHDVRVTASFGVAQHEPGATPTQLLIQADACLYRAKAEGKNRVVQAPLPAPRRTAGGATT